MNEHRSNSWHFARAQHPNLVGFDALFSMMTKYDSKSNNPVRFVLPLHKNPVRTQLVLTVTAVPFINKGQIELNVRFPATGEFTYYGAVDFEGVLRPSSALRETDTEEKKAIWYLLVHLRDDPVKVLASLGKKTGTCCICNRPLTDEISVAFGIGPVCADRYGIDRTPKLDLEQFQ